MSDTKELLERLWVLLDQMQTANEGESGRMLATPSRIATLTAAIAHIEQDMALRSLSSPSAAAATELQFYLENGEAAAHVEDGAWTKVRRESFGHGCCDCGLYHQVGWRIDKNGDLELQYVRDDHQTKRLRACLAAAPAPAQSSAEAPVDMLLFCPDCKTQHVDAPNPAQGWTNPPHATHTCHRCGLLWRPSNSLTNGVKMIEVQEEKHLPRIMASHPRRPESIAAQPSAEERMREEDQPRMSVSDYAEANRMFPLSTTKEPR